MQDFKTSRSCCQVGSPWSISGIRKPQLCVLHPSPLHTWANPGLVCSGWDGNWGGDRVRHGLKALVLGRRACKMVWRGQTTAVTTAMTGRETLRPPVAELAGPPGFSKCFQTFQGHCRFWPLSRNRETQRERTAKGSFHTVYLTKPQLIFQLGFWGVGLEELPVLVGKPWSCSLIRLLWTSDSWSLPAAGKEDWRGLRQSCWRQGEFFPWTLTTLGRLKLFHRPVLLLFSTC